MVTEAESPVARDPAPTVGIGAAPWVGVVIPCYMQAHFLRDAVESVLSQDYANLQIIIVDDGSPDDPASAVSDLILADRRIRLVSQENAGLASARNRGFREAAASVELFLFLDADDRLEPGAVGALVNAIESNPAAPAVHGVPRFIDVKGEPCLEGQGERSARHRETAAGGRGLRVVDRHSPSTFEMLAYRNTILSPGQALIRRSALERHGLFDPSQNGTADWDLWLRLASRSPIAFCDQVVLEYRRHGANMSSATRLMRRHELRFRRKALARIPAGDPRRRVLRSGFRLAERWWARTWTDLAVQNLRHRRFIMALKCLRRAILYYLGALTGFPFFWGGRR